MEQLKGKPTTAQDLPLVTAIIPAYNEKEWIGNVIKETREFVDEIVVVDDGSIDGTRQVAERLGAKVVSNNHGKGYIGALKTGFKNAGGEVIVTLDADGEHNPGDIPQLTEPILKGKADLVLGRREKIPRISERLINRLTNLKVKISDSGTGFRAMKRELALKLDLKGKCTCGILVLEASHYGVRITEVPVTLRPVLKKRKIAWNHFWQIFFVLRLLLLPRLQTQD